ncbi:MAG: MBOAT family protein, partial [Lachnospiraceae bacterium]|nr:MBOAT family protein [Lachnospiraceae bacterium]
MLFSSITFLFMFLPATLLLYYISPDKIKNIVLLICSLLFYAWGEPRYVIVMLVMVCIGYGMGRLTDIQKKKQNKTGARVVLVCTIIVDIGVLFFFKYMGFFASNIKNLAGIDLKLPKLSLPLGISFYTFQLLSYNIDVYRGTIAVQKNIRKLFTYITLFPQLIAGPIVRYDAVCAQLDRRIVDTESFGEGAKRFIIGLAKKVLLANMAGEIHDMIIKTADAHSTILLMWIGSFAFTVQIYFDFSGYSDMAIGLGRM